MIKAYRLFAGADGNSHVEVGWVLEDEFFEAGQIRFKETPAKSVYDWHNAPTDQYVLSLEGTLNFETKTGDSFTLKPGEVLIAQDTTGTAHKWQMIGDLPWKRAYVKIKQGSQINFIPTLSE